MRRSAHCFLGYLTVFSAGVFARARSARSNLPNPILGLAIHPGSVVMSDAQKCQVVSFFWGRVTAHELSIFGVCGLVKTICGRYNVRAIRGVAQPG